MVNLRGQLKYALRGLLTITVVVAINFMWLLKANKAILFQSILPCFSRVKISLIFLVESNVSILKK